jgi:hypothetical protein
MEGRRVLVVNSVCLPKPAEKLKSMRFFQNPRPLRAAGLQNRFSARIPVGRVTSRGVGSGFERASHENNLSPETETESALKKEPNNKNKKTQA